MRVLVVEDDEVLADGLARGLRQDAIAVDLAGDGRTAIEKVSVNTYDVVVLDRDLPLVHGDDVCRHVAESGIGARVLMLTAASGLADRVAGLELGADDYLPKPFAMVELLARVHALARRTGPSRPPVLCRGDISVSPAERTATRAGRDIRLTRKEFGVLEALMAAEGAIVSAEQLLESAWDEHVDPFTNALRVTMVTLRRKLGEPPVIETEVGVGYRIL